ncbi:MAG: cyanophycin synthetase, partial [Candidatus Uhrbacteria bacterium]|nr:cyanophycin synthetase [Candidatus Uhrbacteria bacterium]
TDRLGTVADVLSEKGKIFCRHSTPDHWMVLSADEPLLRSLAEKTPACVMLFGMGPDAYVRVDDITQRLVFKSDRPYANGLSCTVTVGDQSARAEFPHIIGAHILSTVLSAVAVGSIYRIPLQKIITQLAAYQSPKSRMRPIPGIKGTLILDDTYNSSPKAARGALDVLAGFEIDDRARRIAVLGDMRELGEISQREHRTIGAYVAENGIDMLMCVGGSAEFFAAGARDAGLDESKISVFNDAQSAGTFLQNELRSGDVVLVKGSQAVRLERIVKEVMADPLRASELLVRQEEEWQK